jgi:hypothetical protein
MSSIGENVKGLQLHAMHISGVNGQPFVDATIGHMGRDRRT